VPSLRGQAYSLYCLEKLFQNCYARANRLTIRRVIAAYTNASPVAHSLS
jgi:hypothetical protein